MKKEYIRPEAEKINFQAEEVMTEGFEGAGGNLSMDPVDWLVQTP